MHFSFCNATNIFDRNNNVGFSPVTSHPLSLSLFLHLLVCLNALAKECVAVNLIHCGVHIWTFIHTFTYAHTTNKISCIDSLLRNHFFFSFQQNAIMISYTPFLQMVSHFWSGRSRELDSACAFCVLTDKFVLFMIS